MKIFTNLALTAALTLGATAAYAGTFSYQSLSPAAGSTIDVGTTVEVQFADEVSFNTENEMSASSVNFTFVSYGWTNTYTPSDDGGTKLSGSTLSVTFAPDSWQQEAGATYTFNVPAGALINADGDTNEAIAID
ncbi:MAG: hypothetical protein LUD17_08400 [Bacteroidales bacterium]|nr:hypothetical protein [Bacteroidales bacterium]